MNFTIKLLNVLLLSFSIFAQDPAQTTQATEIEQSVTTEVAAPHVHTCSCGPTEHWFHKACVKNYNKLFPLVGLPENFDTEGLSTNILQAIEMLAQDICFVAQDGMAIVPELNAKGKLVLKMGKNQDYVLCKEILKQVDVQSTLTAQELYQEWSDILRDMKSAQ